MKQTREEMISVFKSADIEDAERLVAHWTYDGRADNVSQIMRLMITAVDEKMHKFIIPYSFAAVGMDVYDAHALLGYVLQLSYIGIMPAPMEVVQS